MQKFWIFQNSINTRNMKPTSEEPNFLKFPNEDLNIVDVMQNLELFTE